MPHFQRAVEIDPQFAKAYAHMGVFYRTLGEFVLAKESIAKAYQLRDRTSEQERFFITVNYDRLVTGNLEEAQQTLELWAQTYPRDKQPRGFLSAVYPDLGKYEKSIEQGKLAVGIDPDFTPGYLNQIWSDLDLDRVEEAEKVLQQVSERKLGGEDVFILPYYIAFLKGDMAGMERAVALAQGKPVEDLVLDEEAFVLAYSGRLQQARAISRRAVELAQQADHAEKAAIYEAGAAVREAFLGNAPEARQSATAALELSKNRDVGYGAAFALALSGDSSRPQTLADDLEKRFPEDTEVRFTYVPTLRAVLALNNGEPQKAIELLQTTLPYDFAVPGTGGFGFFGFMYPVYVRGEGYLTAHRYAEAAAEFRKILDHRGLLFADPVGAVARWQLGKALALSGDTAKAKTAYQDFLTLWKDADPGIPILIQAKAEYAKLR
jgi:tetratricopeptide (TPR) repeat protein